RKRVRVLEALGRDVVAPQLLVEDLPPQFDRSRAFLEANQVFDLVPGIRRHDVTQPVAAWLVPGRRDDLNDVAVLEPRSQRHHLSVDARPDALVADISVDPVGEINRRRASRKRLHLAAWRKRVDLFWIELDFQVLNELPGVP